jgi:hypothetical protein
MMIWGANNRLSQMTNLHTCTVRGVDVFSSLVLVVDSELV